MANSLNTKRAIIGTWQLVACLALMANPVVALAQFQPGLQHVYPFYYPEGPEGVSAPAILTGLSGGTYDASNCRNDTAYPTPPGYTISYDCENIESFKAEVVAGGVPFDIHPGIRDKTEALFSALNEQLGEGNEVSAGGWRSFHRQIELRFENECGNEDGVWKISPIEGIWGISASDCGIPTARPGHSNHEQGLAVDVYYVRANRSITRGDPAFRWLQANAKKYYGFKNLKSEPWHWSVNGR